MPDTNKTTLVEKLTNIADGFRTSRSLTSQLSLDEMATLAAEPIGGAGKLPQVVDKTVTKITAEDLEGATKIGDGVFFECLNLTSVTIPDSVEGIGNNAFFNCHKLVEVINKSSLTITAGSSSNGYVAYYALEVHGGESKIVNKGDYQFYTVNGVNYLVNYIGNDTEITLPENYNGENYVINHAAFWSNDKITKVTIPDSVTSIGSYAFYGCDNLTSVTIGNGVTSIGQQAFSGCDSLASIIIPDSVTSIDGDAFGYCDNLVSVIIPDSVTSIGTGAFAGCTSLTSITIPDRVTKINYNTFNGCTSLTSITIPDSVTKIGERAFHSCSSLTSVRIGSGIKEIYAGISETFKNCTDLTDIYIDKEEDSVSGAPWGATNATVHWNTPLPTEEA